ncbi:MAG: mycothiol synthase [Jiangellaceae bacterium]|nr:mycothiol synthase [Jiangellaceae bacterium]
MEARQRLDGEVAAAVAAIRDAATKADHVGPMSEQALLRVRFDAPETEHLLGLDDGVLAGYAQLDHAGSSAEVVVHPDHRRRGIGRALVTELLSVARGREVRVWAHGDLPAAAALAAATGFAKVRSLWLMRRPIDADLPELRIPYGITVHTFRPGVDDEAWVAVNARAFADHPEQGRLTVADLHQRTQQPWFDPAGFFVAWRAATMAGFHWTKVHDATTGEVYVLGIDPTERGNRLGKALLLVGLHHLQRRGLAEAILYVEETNTAGIGLYTELGFTRVAVDVMYANSPE